MNGLLARHGSLCRFYTQRRVGEVLVDLMGVEPPHRLLDLASGAGALSSVAFERWKPSELVTVDIDAALSITNPQPGRRHVVADALDVDLPKRLLCGRGIGFDALLCNPPYQTPEWRRGFSRILDEAGFANLPKGGVRSSAEVLFIAQALRLARDGGRLGLIVPDGLITGRRSAGFRSALLANNGVSSVVQLPRGAFRFTEARAFLLLLRKHEPSDSIALYNLSVDGRLSSPLFVSTRQAIERLDFGYHAATAAGGVTLADLGGAVVRGSLESNTPLPAHVTRFHTCDFPHGDARLAVALADQPASDFPPGFVIAEAGDILMARVDRFLHRKVCLVTSGRAALTSSVYRVRIDPARRQAFVRSMLSDAGQQCLAGVARGVGARMLGKEDLLKMPLPL